MCLKTYIVQYTHSNGNGWAIINCPSPSFIENILKKQSKMLNVQVVSYSELRYFGEEMGLVYEGCITTIGQSPYDIAVANGFRGSVTEWLQSLVGPEGSKGDKGDKGDTGEQGIQGIQGVKGDKGDKGSTGPKGETGAPFTYDMFTPEQLEALKGPKGDTGAAGEKGDKGDKGDTGEKGDKGDQGIGIPTGGTTGQLLAKKTNTNYDTEWQDPYDDTQVRTLIQQTADNFANYYTKSETYSQAQVDQLLRTQREGQYVPVNALPTASAETMFKIYLVPSSDPQTSNIKDEYITIDNGSEATTRYTWEKIGSTDVDLSGYSTTEEMNAAIQTALADYYTKTETDTLLGGKQDTINDLSTIRSGAAAGATAVQPEAGKGLFSGSYNDLTNKPTIPTTLSQLSEDATHRVVSDTEKTTWNNKSNFSGSYNDLTDKPTIPAEQVQSDWNQTNNSSKDFIKNKPTIPTVPTNVSAFTNDAGYLTQHQSLSDYVQKSQTAGLIKNDGTIDTNTYLTQHQDISGKADKSEMSVTDGTGTDADKTTITLKTGTSATVLKSHQSLSGKQDVIDSSHKLSADLVDDTNTTNKFTNATEKQTWNGKQDALVSGTNIKTINNESILGSGNITIQGGGGSQVQSDWNQSDNTAVDYIKNKPTIPVIPNNLAYTSNDNGEGIVPSDGIRVVTVTNAATMTISPDVVTVIDGAVGTTAITLQVPQDNLAHVWDILMTTDSSVAITFAMSNSATILTPSGFSVGASKAVEISVIGVGTKYYLRYGEFA